MTTPKEAHLWRREIQHGPEGEANYAWLYDAGGEMVGFAKTYHAEAIVTRMNEAASLQGEDAVERVARIIIGPRLPVPDNCQFTLEELRSVRWSQSTKAEQQDALNAGRAILATGLVSDEAAIRADEREKCARRVEELDCLYVNDERCPFGGIPADPETSIQREAIKECLAAIRSGGGE